MLIDSRKGRFKLESNYRDAFKQEAFEEKYIEECFDKFLYIVGDISSGILRLKGFDTNPQSKNYYGFIEDYLDLSCAMGCPFYVLKRIQSENEYQKEKSKPSAVREDGFVIHPLLKESYDKENIILETTPCEKPNIVINETKLNAIPKGKLSTELAEIIAQEKANNTKTKPKEVEQSQSYVSSSPGFVPNTNKNNFNRNKKRNKK